MLRTTHTSFLAAFVSTCALLAGSATAQTCIAPPVGVLGWWPGDGNSTEVVQDLHGVALNGASYGPGLVGQAFELDASDAAGDDRVDLPPSALDGLADVTIEMWLRTEDDRGSFLSAASDRGAAFNNEMLLHQGVSGPLAVTRQETTGGLPTIVNDGSWHHLAYVRSGSLGIVYIDGIIADARSVPAEPFEVGPGGLMLGQEQDCLGGCLDPRQALSGLIDELTIYDRALSDAEIVAIFDAGELGKCKPLTQEDVLEEQIAEREAEIETLLDRIAEAEITAEEVAELEAEMETLRARIAELEATAEEAEVEEGDDRHHFRSRGQHRKHWNRRDWGRHDKTGHHWW